MVWRPIPGFIGIYEVSDTGLVKSLARFTGRNYKFFKPEFLLSIQTSHAGYKRVFLSGESGQKPFLLHRIVALAFIDNPDKLAQINHKDGDKSNNAVENLEWCTGSQNAQHALEKGLRARGFAHKDSKNIKQLDGNDNLIKTWSNGKEIYQNLRYDRGIIRNCCTGKRQLAYGFKWKYA